MKASYKSALRKPDAGNLHVRFEEGEGHAAVIGFASHPVRPSLLYLRKLAVFGF